jgi:hypothetical protein
VTHLVFRGFSGEVPRLPAHELAPGNAQEVIDADLQHAEVRGLNENKVFAVVPSPAPIKAVFTDDGINFYAWPYEVYPVKSMVPGDVYWRLYYTAMQADGPMIKVARTRRADGSDLPPAVIGTALVGGNWQPPERSNPGDLGTGPDSWVLGVPAPEVQGNGDANANLGAVLVDKTAWPNIPKLALRVTYFLETPEGKIAYQIDISNSEVGVHPLTGVAYPQIEYTNAADATRGNKVQDMLWPLGYQLRPFTYYFFEPPVADTAAFSRTVDVLNTGGADIVITYGGTTSVDPGTTDVIGGTDGNEA